MVLEVERSSHLDGLRGLAACGVFFGHMMIALFPSVVTESPSDVHTTVDMLLGLTPVAFAWNGNFGVCIFFVLSGYVLSNFCAYSRISFPAKLLRRYLRLALPMLITSSFAWLLLVLGAYGNSPASEITRSGWLGGWYHFDANFLTMVREALYGAFERGANTYNPNLWTMQIELTGSVYVFILYALFKTPRERLTVILIFAAFHIYDYYVLFAVGALFYDARHQLSTIWVDDQEWVSWGLFIIGLLLGATTWVIAPIGEGWLTRHSAPEILHLLNRTLVLPILRNAQPTMHEIGAVLLFLSLLSSGRLRQFFGKRSLTYLGRISFVLYLIHIPIICSVMSWTVFYLPATIPYPIRALSAALVTIGTVFVASIWANNFVDVSMTGLSRIAGNWFDQFFVGEIGSPERVLAMTDYPEAERPRHEKKRSGISREPAAGLANPE